MSSQQHLNNEAATKNTHTLALQPSQNLKVIVTGQHVSSAKKETLESLKRNKLTAQIPQPASAASSSTSSAPLMTKKPLDDKNLALTVELERCRQLIVLKDNRITDLDHENFEFRDYINSLEQEAMRIKDGYEAKVREARELEELAQAEKEQLLAQIEELKHELANVNRTKNECQRRRTFNEDDEEYIFLHGLPEDTDPIEAIKILDVLAAKQNKYVALQKQIARVLAKYIRESSSAADNQTVAYSALSRQTRVSFTNATGQSSVSNTQASSMTKKRRTTTSRRSSNLFGNPNSADAALVYNTAVATAASISLNITSLSEGDCTVHALSPASNRQVSQESLKSIQQRIDLQPLATHKYASGDRSRGSANFEEVYEEDEAIEEADRNIGETTQEIVNETTNTEDHTVTIDDEENEEAPEIEDTSIPIHVSQDNQGLNAILEETESEAPSSRSLNKTNETEAENEEETDEAQQEDEEQSEDEEGENGEEGEEEEGEEEEDGDEEEEEEGEEEEEEEIIDDDSHANLNDAASNITSTSPNTTAPILSETALVPTVDSTYVVFKGQFPVDASIRKSIGKSVKFNESVLDNEENSVIEYVMTPYRPAATNETKRNSYQGRDNRPILQHASKMNLASQLENLDDSTESPIVLNIKPKKSILRKSTSNPDEEATKTKTVASATPSGIRPVNSIFKTKQPSPQLTSQVVAKLAQKAKPIDTTVEKPPMGKHASRDKKSSKPNNKDFDAISSYLEEITDQAAESDSVNSSNNSSCNNSRRNTSRSKRSVPRPNYNEEIDSERKSTHDQSSASHQSISRKPKSTPEKSLSAPIPLAISGRKKQPQRSVIEDQVNTESNEQKDKVLTPPERPAGPVGLPKPPLPPQMAKKQPKMPKRPIDSVYENMNTLPKPPMHPNSLLRLTSQNSASDVLKPNNHISNSFNNSTQNDTINSTSNASCSRSPQSPNPSSLNGKKMKMSPPDEDNAENESRVHFPTGESSARRARKPISYKEQQLNVKMRRDSQNNVVFVNNVKTLERKISNPNLDLVAQPKN